MKQSDFLFQQHNDRAQWQAMIAKNAFPYKELVRFAFTLAFVASVMASAFTADPATAHGDTVKHPNVILMMSDDQGWGDLSMNGNTNVSTPHIDRLGKNGAIFKFFYVSPVCSPTRAELLTGRYHPRSGVYSTSSGGERLDLDETTMANVFKKAGYVTGAFGKWHNGMQYPYHPNGRGFDDFYGFCSGHWGNYFSPLLESNGKLLEGNGYLPDDITEKALQYVERNRNKPFFLYLPFNTPHSPMQVPDRWWKKFEDKTIAMLRQGRESEDINFTRAALAMAENIDWNVGRLMARLQELELDHNTIVVYLSDNGPNSFRWNGGMKGRKGSVDEGGVRSPMVIQWPRRIVAGQEIDQIAGAIDLLPTLASLAGIEYRTDKPLDGENLAPLLLKQDVKLKDRFLFSYWNGKLSVRNQRYRMDDQGRLFDIQKDLAQQRDIAGAEPQTAEKLRLAAKKFMSEVVSELPLEDERPFPLGHPDVRYTQMPARDGVATGNIKRSNRFPNSSFFTNWTSTGDAIVWDVEVLAAGDFEAVIYYTCPAKDVGATVQLSLGESKIVGRITEAHDPPLIGMENDRVERMESYVKKFKPYKLGVIHLEKGRNKLTIKALHIPGSQVMDLSLIMFARVDR